MNDAECKICNRIFDSVKLLSCHLKIHKISSKDYYDNYFKESGEGICKTCGSETKYDGLTWGYKKYCCARCTQLDPEVRDMIQSKRFENKQPVDVDESIELAVKMKGTYELDKLVCQICGRRSSSVKGVLVHSAQKHYISKKIYYDIFFKKDGEGVCYCGKETTFHGFNQYSRFCCHACATSSEECQIKSKQTSQRNYGVDYTLQSDVVKEKIKATTFKKYGVENPSQNKDVHQKKIYTIRKNYGVDYSFQAEEVKLKIKERMIENHGVENASQNSKIQQKKIDTSIERYGVDHPSKTKEFQEKRMATCVINLGVDNPGKCKRVREKTKSTCNDRYGYDYALQSPDVQEKGKLTSLKKYGKEYWTQTPEGRKSLRENHIARIKIQEINGEPLSPNIGDYERQCFHELQNHCQYEIIRPIYPVIGYYPDGIIPELKLELEFDERYHFLDNYKTYRPKDIQRDLDLAAYYGYIVYRIKLVDWINDPLNVIEKFKEVVDLIS